MARKGWLTSQRKGRHSYYDLTPRGRRLLQEGEARIFHPARDTAWDGIWFMVAYSIPEVRRHLRDRLRTRLAWLGFGPLGNGVWITPHDVEARVSEVADEMGISGHMDCFRARHLGAEHLELVKRCWDLPALDCRYQGFIHQWTPELDRCRSPGAMESMSDVDCFTLRFRLIGEYREFPLEDPYLPRELLPPAWQGDRAAALFNELHDLLEGPAERYVDSVLGAQRAPRTRGALMG
jgi:phenylacetic acid degradation operon negative regulatory protein